MTDKTTPETTFYRHYKGGLYRLLAWAQSEDTGKPVAVYQSAADGMVWVRSREEFLGTVHSELPGGIATRVRRFELVKEHS